MAPSTKKASFDEFAIVESLYEAALEPDLLPDALHAYARALNGSIGHALTLGRDGSRPVISRDGREGAAAYAREWWKHDVATQRSHARRLKGSVNTFDLTTPEERSTLPYYQEFSKEFECFWGCAQILERPGGLPLAVGVRRPERFGPFNHAELQVLGRLGRHVARAIDIATQLEAAAAEANGFCQALTHLGHGVIGISGKGSVLFANDTARALCGDGISISNGMVMATIHSRQVELDGLVSQTLALANATTTSPPRPVPLPRASGRAPLVVYGFPVSASQAFMASPLGGRPRAMLLIIEPDAGRALDERLLQQMFGLTRAEARVAAAVGGGMAPRQAAQSFGIAEGSLRVQLKRVFHKIGVSRQVELALLLAPLLHGSPDDTARPD